MELVSPAGNLEKLKYAYLFGADAAYIGIKDFSLRARADNFKEKEYEYIKKIKGKKRLFGAINIFFQNSDIKRLESELDYLSQYPFDAFILSDIGILKILKKYFPKTSLHLSTQANCINANAAAMYKDMGFKRIVLGREVSLKDAAEIKNKVDIELEIFVHGAMCLAYSGRCFLSRYMINRSANKGDCAHSCRWDYLVLEENKRRGEYFPVIEGDNFTTILSSKDICMINHLDKIRDAGIDSLKIEGRMKSIYYTAIVTRAYRKVLDNLKGKKVPELKKFKDEIYKVSHREFSTGFYLDEEDVLEPATISYSREYMFLGTIGKKKSGNTYNLDIKNQIKKGDTLEYIGFDIFCEKDNSFKILNEYMDEIEKIDHNKIGFLVTDKPIKEGYIIRKKI